MNSKLENVYVRIGSGLRLHPAVQETDPAGNVYSPVLLCGCPGTKNGHALYRHSVFPATEANAALLCKRWLR